MLRQNLRNSQISNRGRERSTAKRAGGMGRRLLFERLEGRAMMAFDFAWAFNFNSGTGGAPVNAVATDAAGNAFFAGQFEGNIDVDPGPGIANLSSAGSTDAFVAKYTPAGALVWAQRFGGVSGDVAMELAVDAGGNVYFRGQFTDSADFGSITLTAAGGTTDIFVAKLDSAGAVSWARRLGNADGGRRDEASDLAIDGAGNVYVTGIAGGTADFGPFTLVALGAGHEGFVAKLDTNGSFTWAKQFDFGGANGTGAAGSFPDGIAVDPSGNVYLAGHFTGNVDFNPGPGSYTLKSSTRPGGFFTSDVFVVKLNSTGGFAWAESLGTGGERGDDGATDIATDAAGNVYVTGAISANGPVDFNPGKGTYKLPGGGAFVFKWDTNRNFIWARRFADGATPFSLAVDSANNVYMTGIGGVGDFDPGPGTFNLSGGDGVLFVLKLDAGGNFSYAADFGIANPWYDKQYDVAVDAGGNVLLVGAFLDTGDFDPGAGTFSLTSPPLPDNTPVNDGYVLKLTLSP